MRDRKPAEVFPPGEYIKEEIDSRGWTQNDLAEILGRPTRLINELISGKRGITPETAKGLAGAFGTSAQFWMNLESIYRLFLNVTQHDIVERRAALYAKAPVRAMIRRNWIEQSNNIDILESTICSFFNARNINEDFHFSPFAARKSTSQADLTIEQNAWLFRALHMARAVHSNTFSKSKFEEALRQIKLLLFEPAEIRKIPRILSACGIRFIIIEALPQSKIDGAAFWLENTPVVALSLRYDRIDYFWYTFMHELGHVKNEDGKGNENIALDVDLEGETKRSQDGRDYERLADNFASNFLVSQKELNDFIARIRPLYSKGKIVGFANRIKIHPGIVVGQIHYREKNYSHFREFLIKIRHIIINETISDGWGSPYPTFSKEA